MQQQHHTSSEGNNLVLDPQIQEKTPFLLHPLPLVVATSAKARDTMNQHAKRNASQT